MALEVLRGLDSIRGEGINHVGASKDGWGKHIIINHEENMISFRIQKGPIGEVGKNGCQVVDIIAGALEIIDGLNILYPSDDNTATIVDLKSAIEWQDKRTKDREQRNVEGKSEK